MPIRLAFPVTSHNDSLFQAPFSWIQSRPFAFSKEEPRPFLLMDHSLGNDHLDSSFRGQSQPVQKPAQEDLHGKTLNTDMVRQLLERMELQNQPTL